VSNLDEEAFEAARAAWLESASDYTRLDDSIRAAILAYESAKTKEAASPAAPGIPSEEEIDRVVTGLYRRFKDWSKHGFTADDVTWCEVRADVVALIRPAFEAKEREIADERARVDRWQERWQDERDARLSAEAKLAQAVEALEPFNDMLGEDDDGYPDDTKLTVSWRAHTYHALTLGDLRRARTASAMGERPALASGKETP
jgi:hypothetical protein